jgi:tRNA-2-methylthio-N6-dimethylallyladenosine synthase
MNLPNYIDAKKRTKESTVKELYKFNINSKNLGVGKTYFVKTYGCQMNEHDSENIRAMLEELQFTPCEVMEEADLVILNTCSIRENAHNKAFGMLGRLKHLKESKKDLVIGLCGCMAQEESVVKDIMEKHPYVDIVFGTHNIHELQDLLINRTKKQNIDVYSCEGKIYENISYKRESDIKAWVNIQYGCDKFCTYCIVPYTRGKQRSRKSAEIIKEVEELVKKGYKEVTLLGQNVNAYGKDLYSDYTLANLLSDVADTGIERLRFVTSHPWDFTDEMVDIIAKRDNIMPYIHLPLQSGSNKILKLMNRRYTKEEYLKLYKKLKDNIPNVSITTDIIVGFPGETREDFEETLDVVKKCKYDSAFTFIFSPREGTPATKMIDNVSLDEKNKRLYELNELVNKYANKANQRYLNKTTKVLIEGIGEKGNLFGYTDTMKLVNVKADKKYIGKIVDVKILESKTWSLDGEINE